MGIIYFNFKIVDIPGERHKGGLGGEVQVLIVSVTCKVFFFPKERTKVNEKRETSLNILIGTDCMSDYFCTFLYVIFIEIYQKPLDF